MPRAPSAQATSDPPHQATTTNRHPSESRPAAGGLTLLTDPNFLHRGQHAYPGYGLVSKRLPEPLADFIGEMQRRGMAERIVELRRGSSVTI